MRKFDWASAAEANPYARYALAWMAERDRLQSLLGDALGDEIAAGAVTRCAMDVGKSIAEIHPGLSNSETQVRLLVLCAKRAESGESAKSLIEWMRAMSAIRGGGARFKALEDEAVALLTGPGRALLGVQPPTDPPT